MANQTVNDNIVDYAKFISQKHKPELKVIKELIDHTNQLTNCNGLKLEKALSMYKFIVVIMEIPNLTFSHSILLFNSIVMLLRNIKAMHSEQNEQLCCNTFIVNKLKEALQLMLCDCELTDSECELILHINYLSTSTPIEKYIKKKKTAYIANYLRRKLLPYWKHLLSPECINYVMLEIEKNIKETNDFIPIEDLINRVYFVENKPHDWQQQLTHAGVPYE